MFELLLWSTLGLLWALAKLAGAAWALWLTWAYLTGRLVRKEATDEDWIEGYNYGEDEVQEYIEGKDAFIAQQAELLQVLVAADLIKWDQVTVELRDRLADYV